VGVFKNMLFMLVLCFEKNYDAFMILQIHLIECRLRSEVYCIRYAYLTMTWFLHIREDT